MLNTNSLATLRFLELSHDRSEPRAFGCDEARRFLEATERFRSSPNDGGKTRVRRLAATGWPLIYEVDKDEDEILKRVASVL